MATTMGAEDTTPKGLGDLDCDILGQVLEELRTDYASLHALRLASRGMCAAVDGYVTNVYITLQPEHLHDCKGGQLPSLARFKNLTSATLSLRLNKSFNPSDAILLATQPFLQLPLETRQRIKRLKLSQPACDAVRNSEIIVSAVVRHLPGLQQLDMRNYHGISLSYQHSTISLPHLNWLSLPSCRAGKLLFALTEANAGNLQYLEIHGYSEWDEDENLEPVLARCISQLQGLRELRLHKCTYSTQSIGRSLLRSLPASLQRLQLEGRIDDGWEFSRLHAQLEAGRFVAVSLLECKGGELEELLDLGRQLSTLTAGAQLQQPLGELYIDSVELTDVVQLGPADLEGLCKLQAYFAHTHVEQLLVNSNSPALMMQMIELMGIPMEVGLRCPASSSSWMCYTKIEGMGSTLPPPSGVKEQQQLAQATKGPQVPELSSAEELMNRAIARMVSGGPPPPSRWPADLPFTSEIFFLMRGPVSEGERIRGVLAEAEEKLGGDCIKTYTIFQAGGTVCFAVATFNRLAIRVRAAVSWLVKESGLEGCVEVLAAGCNGWYDELGDCGDALMLAMEEVLQEAWSAAENPDDPSSWRPLLEWLVRLMGEFVRPELADDMSGSDDE
ncbi:hypothetical protein Agub_g5386 [Astrephomene gubernaculifera]|uniref:Uncharacterized protein n=1 Tax=Astrephomene gubernaculifera TaxID=47775 RepID=A0AAD3DMA0_9CHLO|nr:hypothetical protein Agub_g5386 [Astrephomene gubernaculifera]